MNFNYIRSVTLTLKRDSDEMKEVLTFHDFHDYIKIFENLENPLQFLELIFNVSNEHTEKKKKNWLFSIFIS